MAGQDVLSNSPRVAAQRHSCRLYRTEREHLEIVVPFVRQTLAGNEKIVCVVDPSIADLILSRLREAQIDTQQCIADGQLCFIGPGDSGADAGEPDPGRVIALLRNHLAPAGEEGFAHLRIACDMAVALADVLGCRRLGEHEARLHQFLAAAEAQTVCCYDRRRFEASFLLDILEARACGPSCRMAQQPSPDELLDAQGAFFRMILEHTTDGINVTEIDLKTQRRRLVLCNDRFVEMSGRSREQLMAADDLNKLGTSVDELPAGLVVQCLSVDGVARGMASWIRPDGKDNCYEYTASPIGRRDGKMLVLGIDRDVTQRLRIQKELRKRDALLENIMSHSFDGINVCRIDTETGRRKLVLCNDRFVEMSGRSREELMAIDDLREIVEDVKDTWHVHVAEQLQGGLPRRAIASWKRPDGKENYYEYVASVLEATGSTLVVMGIDRDITEFKKAEDQIRERDELFQQILKHSSDGINLIEFDPQTRQRRLLLCNDRYVEMSGRTRQELMAGPHKAFSTPVAQPSEEELVRQLGEGKAVRGVGSWSRPDGKENYYEYTASVVERRNGKWIIVGIDRDVADRMKVQTELWERNELFKKTLENSSDGINIVEVDVETRARRLVFCNDRFVRMSGFSREQLMATEDLNTLVDNLDDPRPEAIHEIRMGIPNQGVASWKRPDGKENAYEYRTALIGTRSGKLVVMGVDRDITERYKATEALREGEQNLRRILASSPDAIIVSDMTGKIVQCNEAALSAHGYALSEELVGSDAMDLIAESDRPRAAKNLAEALARGYVKDFQCTCLKRDGGRFPAELSISVIRTPSDKAASFITITRDITSRTRAEERLRKSRQQLRSLAARLQSVREEERTRLARGIHDDLGHEMACLKMDLSWLGKSLAHAADVTVPRGVSERLASMRQRLDETIRKIRQTASDLRPGILDDLGLSAALEWETRQFETRTGIKCAFTSPAEQVQLSREQSTALYRICQELLTNVAAHSGATAVDVSLRQCADRLVLKVQDNGRGITGTEAGSSSSLGILGMRERALLLGGAFDICGAPGRGTVAVAQISLTGARPAGDG